MKLFVSWSGALSHKTALILRDWLPSVLQSVEPYVSSEDIDKGSRWSTDIASELENSNFGVICVTRENLFAPWINFEAGALSKSMDKSRVSPLLIGISRSELPNSPLTQFQSTIFNKDEVFKLIESINKANEKLPLPGERLRKIFDQWWPELEGNINQQIATDQGSAHESHKSQASSKDLNDKIETIFQILQQQSLTLNSPEKLLPIEYVKFVLGKEMEDGTISMPTRVMEEIIDIWNEMRSVAEAMGDDRIPNEIMILIKRLNRPLLFARTRVDGNRFGLSRLDRRKFGLPT